MVTLIVIGAIVALMYYGVPNFGFKDFSFGSKDKSKDKSSKKR